MALSHGELAQMEAAAKNRAENKLFEGEIMGNWRMLPPTPKQLALIAEMQEFSEYPLPFFEGKTRGEASDYIDKWIKTAHEMPVDADELRGENR